jgi:ferric hydroxamate transport system substrate-binding protein
MRRRTFLRSAAWVPLTPLTGAPLLGAPLAGVAARPPAPRAPRLVVLDWGLVETLLALGITPVGVAETKTYNDSVVTPLVPPQVVDVGLRLAPSLELLQQLAPDLILINSSQESQRPMLERIAPVCAFAVYTDAGAPYAHSQDVTLQVARLCGCESAGHALIDATARVLASSRTHLAAQHATASTRRSSTPRRPLYLIRFFDARHIGVYGARSLFQDVLDTLDLRNAWQGPTDYWASAWRASKSSPQRPRRTCCISIRCPAAWRARWPRTVCGTHCPPCPRDASLHCRRSGASACCRQPRVLPMR